MLASMDERRRAWLADHFYAGRDRDMAWLDAEGLTVVDEDFDQQDGWGDRHLVLRSPGA
jgi:hypothetical protein